METIGVNSYTKSRNSMWPKEKKNPATHIHGPLGNEEIKITVEFYFYHRHWFFLFTFQWKELVLISLLILIIETPFSSPYNYSSFQEEGIGTRYLIVEVNELTKNYTILTYQACPHLQDQYIGGPHQSKPTK